MGRSSPANFENQSVNLFFAVEMEFDSEVARFWNGYTEETIDGDVYAAAGHLLGVSGIEESGEVSAKGATISITGLDASFISIALNENYQNRRARIIVGTVDDGVFTSYTLFRGRMDVMEITESGDGATLTVSVESRLIDLERPRSSRYTSEDQKTYYPGDLGLDYVADLQDKQINWGKS